MIVKSTQARLSIALGAFALINACAPKVVQDRPVTVRVPVHTPCVTTWPQKPAPLPDGSHWAAMDVRQKAAAVGKWALDQKGYAEQLEAATGGCD